MSKPNFQEDLVRSVRGCSGSLDPKDVLEDIFKTTVAELMKKNVMANKNRMETGFILAMKGFLISEFRKASLQEYQKSEAQYSVLFDKTIQEILNEAAIAHEGEDKAEADANQVLDVKGAFHEHVRNHESKSKGQRVTPGGIVLP